MGQDYLMQTGQIKKFYTREKGSKSNSEPVRPEVYCFGLSSSITLEETQKG